MIRLNIKPISINDCWKGQRFKTKLYSKYEKDLMLLLPKLSEEFDPKKNYQIYIKFGFSSHSSDWDNPIKPFQDVLCKKYGFNDKLIKKAVIEIEMVKKGKEFIEFEICIIN